jgi:hypothetical protein
MAITLDKQNDKYIASGLNSLGRYVQVELSGSEMISRTFQAVSSEKSAFELEKEKAEKDKDTLLAEWSAGKTDDELITRKDMFTRPALGMQIVKGTIYNYLGELYKALENFTYDYQLSPHLEPAKWQKIGKKQGNYSELFAKAVYWNRDESYEKDTYVKWYGKLYKALVKVTDNEEPGTGRKWELITED